MQTWLPIAINKLLYSARMESDLFFELLREQSPLIGNRDYNFLSL